MPNIEKSGCHGCRYADWDADGCTCKLDGLLVGNSSKASGNTVTNYGLCRIMDWIL